MIRTVVICFSLVMCIGCATIADLAVQSVAGAIGGAVGNMADRRMEKALGNDAAKEDEKLEPVLKEFTIIDENDKEIK